MAVRVVAHLTAKPDKVAEMRAALEACIEPTRAEEGCILYELMQNNADPTDFTFVEEWTSDEALDAHLETEHLRELQGMAEELFANSPDIRRYSLVK